MSVDKNQKSNLQKSPAQITALESTLGSLRLRGQKL